MFRYLLGLLVAGLLLSTAAPPLAKAALGRGSVFYLQTERACHDGAVVTVAARTVPSLAATTMAVGARRYSTTTLPLPADEFFPRPLSEYGELLTPPLPISATVQPTPLSLDGQQFALYRVGAVVPWGPLVPTGSTVLVFGDNVTLPVVVQDCYVNRNTVVQGETLDLRGRLRFDAGLARSPVVYRLDGAPGGGTLQLGERSLVVGDSFTQDDIDAGVLRYMHGGGQGASDVFSYTLQQTMRASTLLTGTGLSALGAGQPSLSGDGDVLAFESAAPLVAGDTNDASDIYRLALLTGQLSRASVASDGREANGGSLHPAISLDGGTIAFASDASNLVGRGTSCDSRPDSNGRRDVFVHRLNGDTTRSSLDPASCEREPDGAADHPAIGEYGGQLAFESSASNLVLSDTNELTDIFLLDGTSLTRRSLPSAGIAESGNAARPAVGLDANGIAWVAFESASPLDPADTNGLQDVFVRGSSAIARASTSSSSVVANGPSGAASIAANGRFVAFESQASNLVPGDTNNASDVFVRDRDSDGDGRYDESEAVSTTLVSAVGSVPGNDASGRPSISANGRFVAFESRASNLVPGDTNNASDVFVRDLLNGSIRRASIAGSGAEADGNSGEPSIAADGGTVAFESRATNLVPGDTNNASDVFVHVLGFSSTFPISITASTLPLLAIQPPPAQSVVAGATLGPLPVALSTTGLTATVELEARSSNPTLVLDEDMVFVGSGANRMLTIITTQLPLSQPVTLTITITARAGGRSVSASFPLTVRPAAGGQEERLPLIVR